MTPKEKALELVNKFFGFVDKSRVDLSDNQPEINAKQCAHIAVDEILNLDDYIEQKYWIEVKTEIDLL